MKADSIQLAAEATNFVAGLQGGVQVRLESVRPQSSLRDLSCGASGPSVET